MERPPFLDNKKIRKFHQKSFNLDKNFRAPEFLLGGFNITKIVLQLFTKPYKSHIK